MNGVIYRSTGSWYQVKDEQGRMWNARMKGIFKLEDITSTNPIAVGDLVEMELENEGEGTATITVIHDRRNYIIRQSPKGKYQKHIVAANLDQSLLLATLRDPRTSLGFIDRFLVGSELFHVPAVVIFNKTDIYKKKEQEMLEEIKILYENIGYPVYSMSARDNKGVAEVNELLKNKTTLISGHSGVGKSTFINAIIPGKDLRTKEVSGWSGKGLHTTTFAEMFDLPAGGRIIDTPGMREFGLVEVDRQELSGYFPEMKKRINQCQFNNCLHINEPGCAVKEAVVNGEISEDRYVSYYNILESLDDKKWR